MKAKGKVSDLYSCAVQQVVGKSQCNSSSLIQYLDVVFNDLQDSYFVRSGCCVK